MKTSRFGELCFVVANSHPTLGQEVAAELRVVPTKIHSGPFPNGELDFLRGDGFDASGKDVCIFSSLYAGAGYETLLELEQIIDTVRGSASRVFAVLPFVKDGKSDHQKQFGAVVTFAITAERISASGLDVVAIFDQHSAQHPSIFDTRHHRLQRVPDANPHRARDGAH